MDSLKIVTIGRRNPLRERMRRQYDAVALAADLETRASAMLREIDAKIGPKCGWCQSGLYSVPDTGCPACRTAHNGAAVVESRGGGYLTRDDCRGQPVEFHPCGEILRFH